jgi:hypothetical protein
MNNEELKVLLTNKPLATISDGQKRRPSIMPYIFFLNLFLRSCHPTLEFSVWALERGKS